MSGLEFQPAKLAADDSLAGRLIAGEGPVEMPGMSAIEPAGRPARLGIEAFGTTSPELRAKLERVLAGEGLVVTTGQQPVLFLGPLYVIYKALTAVALASALEERLDVPVVPVFWIASDDHDWDEIGQCTLLTLDGEPRTLRLTPDEEHAGRPAGSAPLGADIGALIDELSQLLPPSEFTPGYLELIRDTYRPETTVARAFAGALAGVLEGSEYAWLDSADPALKRASAELFAGMFRDPGPVLEALEEGEKPLREAGFEPPIHLVEDGLPLFYDDGTRRRRILRDSSGVFTAGGEGSADPADVWMGRLEEEPERFSPNVSSRPVLESWLLPVAATVLGPGEIAYWSQLGPLFDHFGVAFPAVRPRASFLVVEPRIRRVLDNLGVEAAELADGGDEVATRVTADSRPEVIDESLGRLRRDIAGGLEAVQAAVAEEMPGLKAAAGKAGKALYDAVGELDHQVDAKMRERRETTLGRIERAATALWPGRRPQERVLSPFHFLGRYGGDVIEGAGGAIADDL